ncbi:uncharacterized protein YidB (DUF937 family) [Conyzicola lurida]|uniref:Uncharacterized protein YidB (DUF937 family) n=1 Tax=Conyzicola lurida TaxID=1172621 RepID=A0A841AQZ2_9MICO|nr:hypothetical protein [Conyzicola lurida]MBB5844718.1 uncharacterized protein YidB (DUF937 family) [Conyzicola lurida]
MELGPYSTYRLPANLRSAFGVDTAQQLADQLGIRGELTPAVASEADSAYGALVRGDSAPAHALLTGLGVSDTAATAAIAKFTAS